VPQEQRDGDLAKISRDEVAERLTHCRLLEHWVAYNDVEANDADIVDDWQDLVPHLTAHVGDTQELLALKYCIFTIIAAVVVKAPITPSARCRPEHRDMWISCGEFAEVVVEANLPSAG